MHMEVLLIYLVVSFPIMAKSSRSKTQRANRAVKRQRYAVKEKDRLEKIVELAKETSESQPTKAIYVPPEAKPVTDENQMAVDGEEQEPTEKGIYSTSPFRGTAWAYISLLESKLSL